jgi:cell division septation protein DedD
VPKNEEGEFELILGNRQLLSVFFIVVVLLGVFFTMGYIVGRNSGPAANVDVASAGKPEVKPLVVESPVPKAVTPTAPEPAASKPPAEEPARAVTTKPTEAAKRPAAKPEKTARAEPAEPSGTYLQLAATSKHEADLLVDVLRKKSFHALTAEVPEKAGTYRVLVGPVGEGDVNKMRADLQSAGFPGDKAIRRTF